MNFELNNAEKTTLQLVLDRINYYTQDFINFSETFAERYPSTSTYLDRKLFSRMPVEEVREALQISLAQGAMSETHASLILSLPLEEKRKTYAGRWKPRELGQIPDDEDLMRQAREDVKKVSGDDVDVMSSHIYEAPQAFNRLQEMVRELVDRHRGAGAAAALMADAAVVSSGSARDY